jgi:hypothetical protein
MRSQIVQVTVFRSQAIETRYKFLFIFCPDLKLGWFAFAVSRQLEEGVPSHAISRKLIGNANICFQNMLAILSQECIKQRIMTSSSTERLSYNLPTTI